MPKEDRSDWVAVAPDSTAESSKEIKKPLSAFMYFQKNVGPEIKAELGGQFNVADFTRSCSSRWKEMDDQARLPYVEMAGRDTARYNQEMHMADVAAMERQERLQKERDNLMVYDDETTTRGKRTTRGGWEKNQRKKAKKERKEARTKRAGDEEFREEDEDDSGSNQWDSGEDSEEEAKKEQAAKKPRRSMSQKQVEYQEKKKQEKQAKENYIAERQQDLRKEKAAQAKRRLEFLLKQSNIFSHFGSVKQDTAKYGIKAAPKKPDSEVGSRDRRQAVDDEDEALEEADEHEATFLTSQPSTLGFGTMRAYQLEGLNWMIRLQENGVNGILADEMGLGKTLQSISVLVYMLEYQNITGPHLIVVPKSTLSNWMKELMRWAPTLVPCQFHGSKAEREEIIQNHLEPATRDDQRKWNVVVTTYEVCNIEKTILTKFAWSYLIIDEAHRLKNEASAFSKTIRTFETRYRLLLSGTPLQNSLHELWALLNFLVPDVFEDSQQFDEWFNLEIDDNDEKNKLISQLHKILRPFMLRRLKSDAETLPPKHETILFTGMSSMQKELYRNILLRDIDALKGGTGGSRTAILNIVMQLRKCAGHPYLFPGVEDRTLPPLGEHLVENCGKMVLLDKLLKRLKERGHRVLLFTQMTRVLDILEDYVYMRQYSYCRIDGNTSYEDREASIDAYNAENSEKFLFLLSTRAGGLGINLQTADVVILYDSDWNPQADLQAQDRAHRIGQKNPVQVFRFVTEHTIEEKIVERAQQKLKLDAMVVQQGRLKNKDKLSRDELLSAVRFGADKIFKSKDSSITDDDIDLILNQGKQKTEEMNEKLKTAEKGDLLDFKFDGSSVQTFEGIDYSNSVAEQAKSELLGILDLGKRDRKEANYNETSLFQSQMANNMVPKKPKKKKEVKLPKHMRLPRMEEWHMYDREALTKIEEEEEAAFKEWPEELQKAAKEKNKAPAEVPAPEDEAENGSSEKAAPLEFPPLLSEERQEEKERLLTEGFSNWTRLQYTAFTKSSARCGRHSYEKIAVEVGKTEDDVRRFAEAFWGEIGKTRITPQEYEKTVKFIERGEKRIKDLRKLERGTRVFVSLFDNPWEELQFLHVNTTDKMFTAEEDRYLLCWTRKYGYGQWQAIKFAIRRHPNFRFDYFLRSLPLDQVKRRCEQLMKFAEKEIELYEHQVREAAGLPTEAPEGGELPPVVLPKFRELQSQMQLAKRSKVEQERKELQDKVTELEEQIDELQNRLKQTSGIGLNRSVLRTPAAKEKASVIVEESEKTKENETSDNEHHNGKDPGAIGGDGSFVPFPEYDGSEAPHDWKKSFAHFCNQSRREVKASLDPAERKDKKRVNSILKEMWNSSTEEEKLVFRRWSEWDKKRFEHEDAIYTKKHGDVIDEIEDDEPPPDDGTQALHVPKKKKRRT